MKIGIAVKGETQKQEITGRQISETAIVRWVGSTKELLQVKEADLWVDCTFSGLEIVHFEKPTLVHAPWQALTGIPVDKPVARFCAWPGFLSRKVWEVAINTDGKPEWITTLETVLCREMLPMKDKPGLVSPRIVSTIINEAYAALQAGISSAAEIDTAMKLGTNYPYGPLEWCQRIGPDEVHQLLQVLSKENTLYKPAFQVNKPVY